KRKKAATTIPLLSSTLPTGSRTIRGIAHSQLVPKSTIHSSSHIVGQAVCDVLAGVIAAANSHDDILRSVDAVCHWRATLWRRHQHRADFFAVRFVVCA